MKRVIKILTAALCTSMLFSAVSFADDASKNRLDARSDVAVAQEFSDQGVSVIFDTIQQGRVATMLYEPGGKDVSAISFIVKYPKGMTADTSACLADLPDGFNGGCRAVDGEVRVILYHPTNAALPATLLGSVIFSPERSAGNRRNLAASAGQGDFALEKVDVGEIE